MISPKLPGEGSAYLIQAERAIESIEKIENREIKELSRIINEVSQVIKELKFEETDMIKEAKAYEDILKNLKGIMIELKKLINMFGKESLEDIEIEAERISKELNKIIVNEEYTRKYDAALMQIENNVKKLLEKLEQDLQAKIQAHIGEVQKTRELLKTAIGDVQKAINAYIQHWQAHGLKNLSSIAGQLNTIKSKI